MALASCDGFTMPGRTPPKAPTALSDTAQVALGVAHVLTLGGVKRAEVRADSGLFNEAVDHVELRNVRVMFFSPLGDTLSNATAPAATYNLRSMQVTLRGGATVISRGGGQLIAPRILYDATADRLSGDTTYTLSGGAGARTGKSFEADPALRSVRAPRPAAPAGVPGAAKGAAAGAATGTRKGGATRPPAPPNPR